MLYQDENGLIYDGWVNYQLGIVSPGDMRFRGLFKGKCKFTQEEANERLQLRAELHSQEAEDMFLAYEKQIEKISE